MSFKATLSNFLISFTSPRFQMAWRHRRTLKFFPDLRNPRRFTEKLLWKKLYDKNPLMTLTSDKVAVRRFVKERAGEDILTELYGVYDRADEIDYDQFPDSFVIKANHGSSWFRLIPDKSKADLKEISEAAASWLTKRYDHRWGEPWYGPIPPKLTVEEFLKTDSGNPPFDYRFYTFQGKVAVVQVDQVTQTGNDRKYRQNLYYPDWSPINCGVKHPQGPLVPKPPVLDKMIEIASSLGKDFRFVRVDLYEVKGRIVFAELTHCPSGGGVPFTDAEFDYWLGSHYQLD